MSHLHRRKENWVLANPIEYEIAAGNVDGVVDFFGIGERDTIQTGGLGSDLWRGTSISPALPNQLGGEQMMLVSSDYDDRLNGTGVQKIEIDYLDALGREQTEIINMNGTAFVRTVGTNLRFVNVIHAIQVGSGTQASGDISICANGTIATVYNMISSFTNFSLNSQRMIPYGKTFYLREWSAGGAAANATTLSKIRLRATTVHGTRYENTFLFNDSMVFNNSNNSKYFDIPRKIPQLSIIKATVIVSAAGPYVTVSYGGHLKTNE